MANLSTAIQHFLMDAPSTKNEIISFLQAYSPYVQLQFISSIYIGRDHLHAEQLSPLSEISTIVASHINPQEYSQLIYEKGLKVTVYLKKFLFCSNNSYFDINQL